MLSSTNHNNESVQVTHLKDYKSPSFSILEVELTFHLDPEATNVYSKMLIERRETSYDPPTDLVLDGEDLELQSIKLNGETLSKTQYNLSTEHLVIFNVPERFTLEIVTIIAPAQNTQLSGLYYFSDTFCTQCEAEGFRRITFYLDRPDVLARFKTKIIANKAQFPHLLSNGNLIASEDLDNGYHAATWEDPFLKPSYLFALVAGDFDVREDQFVTKSNRMVQLKIYVEKNHGSQTAFAFHALKEAMRWDEEKYGREYDLDIYMIVAISDFNMGAMENKGLNIFNTKFLLAEPATATDEDYIHILSVIGHEYFHNWTGNRVTCRDWFQLSLKEGLTIFRDQSFTEDLISKTAMRIKDVQQLRETQFVEDASPLSHPVMPDAYIEINNFYTATIYNKGAEVLRMLRTILGKDVFRRGMDRYFEKFDGQATTIENFIQTMEEVSDVDLKQFRRWYHQAGTPLVSVMDDYDGANHTYTLTMNQSLPGGQKAYQPLYIPIKMGLLDASGATLKLYSETCKGEKECLLDFKESSQSFKFLNVPSKPIPSLLRDFSSPVQVDYHYQEEELLTLIKHDSDAFNRYEAAQKYYLQIILNLIQDYEADHDLNVSDHFYQLFLGLLNDHEDKYVTALMLTLPSEKYIGEQMPIVLVDAIHHIREFLLKNVAEKLKSTWLDLYQRMHTAKAFEFNLEEIGFRQLKNRCLLYLAQLEDHAPLLMTQFKQSLDSNMTNTEAALRGLNHLNVPQRQEALNAFYERWQNYDLVIDKWFGLQAASQLPNTLQTVKKLMRHEAFNIKNPNRVYALIGTFIYHNQVNFHAASGEGYAFLRETVQQLNTLNPQIAARMVKPLTNWHRYDKERQNQMRGQLELLLEDKKLSKDVYELVSKSL